MKRIMNLYNMKIFLLGRYLGAEGGGGSGETSSQRIQTGHTKQGMCRNDHLTLNVIKLQVTADALQTQYSHMCDWE